MTLPEKLRQLRKERDWTQLEIAKRAGVDRTYISYLEQDDNADANPSAEALLKLAKAFNVKPEELYEAAGYIKGSTISPHPETPEDLLNRLRLATPQSIPVYPWEAFPFHAGDGVEPTEYIYRARPKMTSKNIEAYIVHGNCQMPLINDGNILIIDREGAIDNGDIVACVLNGQLQVLKVRKVAGQIWLENNNEKFKFEDCHYAAPVIEVIRRLK